MILSNDNNEYLLRVVQRTKLVLEHLKSRVFLKGDRVVELNC